MALIVLFSKVGLTPALAILFSALVLLLHSSNALIGFLAWLVSERAGKLSPEAATSADVSVSQCVETQHDLDISTP